ncbi:hypothetical protein [Nocardia salmonicida]
MAIFYAELNNLVSHAGLTHKQIVDDTSGLELTDGQRGRQSGESPRGPGEEFFHAIMCQTAPKVDMPVEEITAHFSSLLAWARQATGGTLVAEPQPIDHQTTLEENHQELTETAPDTTKTFVEAENPAVTEVDENQVARKSAWLLGLVIDGEEDVAVDHLVEEFGADKALLSAVLVAVGQRLPGAVASFLNVVLHRKGLGLPHSTGLFEAIKALDSDTARKIAEVPLPTGAVTAAWNPTGILELDTMLLFGRRVIKLTRRDAIDLACREVVAEIRAPRGNVLGSIIDASEGNPSVVNALLTALSKSHPEEFLQCVLDLIRRSRIPEDRSRLLAFDDALSEDLREMLLRSFSHASRIPNTHTHDFSSGFSDLVGLVSILRVTPHRLAKALTAEKIVTADGLSAGALLEAVTEFQTILEHMAAERLDHTVVLLARALAEWDARLGIPGGAAEQYRPVKTLAEVVLGSAFAYQLTQRMIRTHPGSGTLLFHAMQWLDDPRFPALLTSLTASDVTLDDLIDALVAISKDLRRQMVFEKLISHAPAGIDTIIETVNTKYPHMNLALPAPPEKSIPTWSVVGSQPHVIVEPSESPEQLEHPQHTATAGTPTTAQQGQPLQATDSVADAGATATTQVPPKPPWDAGIQKDPVVWQPPQVPHNDNAPTAPVDPGTSQNSSEQDQPPESWPNGRREVLSPPWLPGPTTVVVDHHGGLHDQPKTTAATTGREEPSSAPRFAAFGRIKKKTPGERPAETHLSAGKTVEVPSDEIFGDPPSATKPIIEQ